VSVLAVCKASFIKTKLVEMGSDTLPITFLLTILYNRFIRCKRYC